MRSILNQIITLRNNKPLELDKTNQNPYCLVFNELDGTKTAYCFGTPIYNSKTKKLLNGKFRTHENTILLEGSNATVSVSDTLHLKNSFGSCRFSLPDGNINFSEKELRIRNSSLFPTTNGVACKIEANTPMTFRMTLDAASLTLRASQNCFALMREPRIPFVVVTPIGTIDKDGNVIAPVAMDYRQTDTHTFELRFAPESPLGTHIMFEVDLYDTKLFQDTTVESRHAHTNNAFGGMAFIGNTELYGEQWLYSRPDMSKLPDFSTKKIVKSRLHIPTFSNSVPSLSAYPVVARFCSFGSTWDKKIPAVPHSIHSLDYDGFESFDITDFMSDRHSHSMRRFDGMIVKLQNKTDGFAAVATGDSYLAPQILEIQFK